MLLCSLNRLKSRRDFNDFNNWTDFNAQHHCCILCMKFSHSWSGSVFAFSHIYYSFHFVSLDAFVELIHSPLWCFAMTSWSMVVGLCIHDLCTMWIEYTTRIPFISQLFDLILFQCDLKHSHTQTHTHANFRRYSEKDLRINATFIDVIMAYFYCNAYIIDTF